MRSVAKEYRVWVFKEEKSTWDHPLVHGCTVVDTLDHEAMLRAARDVAERGISISGILCWDETRVLPSALLAEALGLPTMSSAVVSTCRDKLATRQALERHGASPVSAVAACDTREALLAAATIGYPVVLKPRALVGSNGTTLVTDPEHLTAVFESVATRSMAEVRERFPAPVVVEEYLDGPEISVDSLCWHGKVTPVFIARKHLGFPPHFEEVSHTVDAADPLLRDAELSRVLHAAHAAVGLTHGWTHTEWRLTARGPRLVEINARSGGDLIPYLGRLVTGVDAALAAASLALGERPAIPVKPQGAAAIRFLYPERDTVVGSVHVDRSNLPANVELVEILASPGQELRLPPVAHVTCRYALVIVTGDSSGQCAEALDVAERAVRVVPGR
ncbi:ATP-grasp domain-containing protein [Streptomyces spectabilis]|uniref:ATP-grasp domain-containing protein n=1 Tax=Streptomyces spectabilis TaxID=68270 RepID=A0A516RLD8_STRST|nr:ATP-grasp domain-containing protein [Streptomyces spectabilis]